MSPSGANGSGGGGPYGNSNGYRNSHGNNPYGRSHNNYNPAHVGNWPGSQGPDYTGFPSVPGGVVGGSAGPVRLTHQYRWGPYGGGKY